MQATRGSVDQAEIARLLRLLQTKLAAPGALAAGGEPASSPGSDRGGAAGEGAAASDATVGELEQEGDLTSSRPDLVGRSPKLNQKGISLLINSLEAE